jgi:hypothetical protein
MVGEHLLDELGRFEGDAEILQAWRDGMAPEPALLVSEWADKHRVLGSRGSAEPGPWRTARGSMGADGGCAVTAGGRTSHQRECRSPVTVAGRTRHPSPAWLARAAQ